MYIPHARKVWPLERDRASLLTPDFSGMGESNKVPLQGQEDFSGMGESNKVPLQGQEDISGMGESNKVPLQGQENFSGMGEVSLQGPEDFF